MGLQGLSRLLRVVLLVVVVAVVAGQLLGQPILLGYVTSASMEPTIEAGDGFVAVPAAATGDANPGDVVVYESTDGELVTHRVVDETDEGYVTRGDANPVTDQDRGDPHVTDDRIVATALQVGGTVVTIPGLGTGASELGAAADTVGQWVTSATDLEFDGTSGVATVVLGLSLVGYAVETVRDRRRGTRPSRGDDVGIAPRRLAVVFALFVVVVASAAMLVPAGTESLTVVSSDPAPDGELITEPGGTAETTYRVSNAGFTPVVTYLEPTDGLALECESVVVSGRSSTPVEATLEAPESTGHYERTVDERRYLHVLPRSVIDGLYDVDPWLPFVAIVAVLGGSAYALGRTLAGSERVRTARKRVRSRRRSRSFRFD
ncbi:signal peptidase I [Natronolimnohabitans sp. A-GB9]|uniref:signal peptidase I n=1 Tax=Natronolimnohabitans sp. A-GB9 TaxID=3069757 RepID=UPI0027B1E05D|nr:signal peptidase I [Natronolimnohabitans sp. A-GB9]MDQ2050072.1 signal peptidase I [Natronolimnohabitans sp. A-GB9]